MTGIVEVADGQLIEPPLTVEQRLAAHCAYAEKDFTNGDYFHLLAKDAAALIASQAARIRELEEGLAPFAALGECVLAEAPQSASRLAVLSGCDGGTLSLEFSDLRAAISLLSRKGGE